MAKVGAQRAAELTGKSKSTIQRAMNSGKLSYEIDANNRRIIDVSELERVFGLSSPSQSSSSSSNTASSVEAELKRAADMIEMERMKMKIKALEDQLDIANNQIDDLKGQRDQWQKQAQQVLITSQYSQKQAEEYKAELKNREEQARKRREQMIAERMQKMKGQNQNRPDAPERKMTEENAHKAPAETPKQEETENAAATSFDFQGLWQKIRGGKAA
ncbi:MAG TPA: entry exclusion 1 domain-containing protein [Alphaproteobacteria bacterium]|nr:entry exclusion 1 domain-containing protein [Alphaproteobacteria bacterium]